MAWHDDGFINMFDTGEEDTDTGSSDSWTEETESGCGYTSEDQE